VFAVIFVSLLAFPQLGRSDSLLQTIFVAIIVAVLEVAEVTIGETAKNTAIPTRPAKNKVFFIFLLMVFME